jgi:hypothetical protein
MSTVTNMRELALDELDQVAGGAGTSGGAGPAPAAAFAIMMAAVGGIGLVAGYVLGHLIKGDSE